MNRIICLGNRLVPDDSAGPRVHDLLATQPLAAGVELIDGGTAGLSLSRWLDDAGTVVFVDGVAGFGAPGEVLVLPGDEVAALATDLGHGVGLPEVLRLLPVTCDGPPPSVWLVGLESPADDSAVRRAAARATALAKEVKHAET